MGYCFIVCEYNPLHNGHLHHIIASKKAKDDKAICIMSGNCVQRGELAIADKYVRANWAIQAGADMVIELPTRYVLAPAQIFALGAAKIISHFTKKSYLSFGSEIGDITQLHNLIAVISKDETNILVKENLAKGLSYPKALSEAVSSYCNNCDMEDLSYILEAPNNTLGIEYIKALKDCNCNCIPRTVYRENNYNDSEVKGNYASATAIRENIKDIDFIKQYVPNYVASFLAKNTTTNGDIFSLIKFNLSNAKSWQNIMDVSEGIENRIVEKLDTSSSYTELVEQIKSKRYTLARIKRMLLNGLLSNTNKASDLIEKDIDFVKVLAVNKNSKELLSMFNIPTITSSGDLHNNNLKEDALDLNAEQLFKSVKYQYKSKFQII